MEKSLKESLDFAESIIDTVREPMIVLDQDLRVVTASRSFYDFFKVKEKETVGQLIYDLGNKQWNILRLRELLETILPQKTSFDKYEVEHDFSTIGRRTMLLNARQIEQVMGKERIILLAIEDITERSRQEDLLEESEYRYRRLFETASDGIVLLEKEEGHITHTNPAFEKMLGYSEAECLGKKLDAIDISIDIPNFSEAMKDLDREGILNYKYVHLKTKSGQEIYSDVYIVNRANLVQCNIRDVCERKELQDQLQRSQKMETVGTLASGIAHEFNNMMAVISGNLDILRFKHQPGTPFDKNLDQIGQASSRAIKLVKQFLAFSYQVKPALVPVNFAEVISLCMTFLRPIIPATVEVKIQVPDAPVAINADTNQLQQVIINLCFNSIHAMNEKGVLQISLEEAELKAEEASSLTLSGHPREGHYAKLSVTDTGEGIDKKIIDRIFEPFFTTKKIGKGTGMGLSVAQSIVEQHGGFIHVDSTLGQGTSFSLYFPTTSIDEIEVEIEPEASLPIGTERILLVDDEPIVAEVCRAMLEHLGYNVTAVSSGMEALDLFRVNPGNFDLVMTDQTMPKMSGLELGNELLSIRPEIPVILCSGYNSKVDEDKAKEVGFRAFCTKPIEMRQLASVIRKTLDASIPLSPTA